MNFDATKKLREKSGDMTKVVYWLTPTWSRIGWKKPNKVKNEHLYEFSPAWGFKKRFVKALQADSTLETRFEYFPFIQNID